VGTFTTGITLQTLLGANGRGKRAVVGPRLVRELKRVARIALMPE
jgi:hypothetical protein